MMRVSCGDCGNSYCLAHRFPDDHQCTGPVSAVSRAGYVHYGSAAMGSERTLFLFEQDSHRPAFYFKFFRRVGALKYLPNDLRFTTLGPRSAHSLLKTFVLLKLHSFFEVSFIVKSAGNAQLPASKDRRFTVIPCKLQRTALSKLDFLGQEIAAFSKYINSSGPVNGRRYSGRSVESFAVKYSSCVGQNFCLYHCKNAYSKMKPHQHGARWLESRGNLHHVRNPALALVLRLGVPGNVGRRSWLFIFSCCFNFDL